MGMGHDQFKVVAAVRDNRIDQELALLVFEEFCCFLQEFRVGAGVSGKTAHIRLNHRNGGLGHKSSQYEIAPGYKKITVFFCPWTFSRAMRI